MTIVMPSVLYGAKCQATKKLEEVKVHVVEMSMLRRMCGVPRYDKVRNDYIKRNILIASIKEETKKYFEKQTYL